MREILFRGKDIYGKWFYGDLINLTKEIKEICNHKQLEHAHSVNNETIGQYTGLTDKNGTKIFEGDIIQDYIEPKPKGIIRFGEYETPYKEWTQISTYTHSKHIGFFIEWRNGVFRKDLRFWNEKIEVIGNIHDNPELLKECEGK